MKIKHIPLGKILAAFLASLLLIFSPLFMNEAKAFSIEDTLVQAGKTFLSSAIGDYTKNTQNIYDKNFKSVKATVNDLADQLERVGDSKIKPAERASIIKKISASQKSLRELAASFDGLADGTDKFNNGLESSVENLLTLVKGQVNDKFVGERDAFREISKAVSAIADDTKNANSTGDLVGLLNRVGRNITNLNNAVDVGSKTMQAISRYIS